MSACYVPCWNKYSFIQQKFLTPVMYGFGSILGWLWDKALEVKVPSCAIYFRVKADIIKQHNCYFATKRRGVTVHPFCKWFLCDNDTFFHISASRSALFLLIAM